MKKIIYRLWLITFIVSATVWSFRTGRAQSSELLVCWEDQFASWAGNTLAEIPSNVTLISFCVEYYEADDEVLVTWETGTEIDTLGFYIQRSEDESGTFPRISDFQYSLSEGLAGAFYEYIDTSVERGKVYYYKLEEIDTNNQTVNIFGPISFDFFSPTATPTATPTRTLTPTSTTAGPTATPTRTPTITLTSRPTNTRQAPTATRFVTRVPILAQAVTLTPTPTLAGGATQLPLEPEASREITATATLDPLPPVVLLFPAPTATPLVTVGATSQPTLVAEPVSRQLTVDMQATLSGRVKVLGSIILLIWLALGVFLVLYLRKTNEQH